MRTILLRALPLVPALAWPALAQEHWEPPPDVDYPPSVLRAAPSVTLSTNGLPHVIVTGFWPPTNNMLRQFSQRPDANTTGWLGENWEGRGYNIYAFFPEFPGASEPSWGRGTGDFEVDYQDTSNDFWPLFETVQPIALITFSRAGADKGWELEGGNRHYSSTVFPTWTNDYLAPLRPDAPLPIYNEPVGNERFSSQPIMRIITAVSAAVPTLTVFATVIDNGRFVSNFMGYHGNWWKDLHADRDNPGWCIAGGHIHVGYHMTLEEATAATEVTIRALLEYLDARIALRPDLDGDGDVDLADHHRFVGCHAGPGETIPPLTCPPQRFASADFDDDGDVDLADHAVFQRAYATLVN